MILIKSSETLNLNGLTHNDLLGVVQIAIRDTEEQLQKFTQRPDFCDKMILAFGTSPEGFQGAWANGVVILPEIEIRSSSEINGANGAFAGETNTIYLAQEFLSANANNLGAVVGVLLEEYGHFVDYSINQTDSPGDEGAIFSALVQGENLSDAELGQLKAEDDCRLLALNGQSIQIEQDNPMIVVTNTNDSGTGSLRWAIEQANNTSGIDRIVFNIGDGGVQTIRPLSALPTIAEAVTIDGTTQPGYRGTPLIELDGSQAGTNAVGLTISAGNSTIKRLVINRFQRGIVSQDNGNNTIEGNYIGTDATGTVALANNAGIGIFGGLNNNNIVRDNLISGNIGTAVSVFDGTGNQVLNNLIGTNVTGTVALPNGDDGVDLPGAINTIVRGNTIAGNRSTGVVLRGSQGTVVENNFIGTDSSGTINLGNQNRGVSDENGATNATIRNNTIAFNQFQGVVLRGTGNRLESNRIYSNTGLGIDLGGDGVKFNDNQDIDTGANQLQNYPILASVTSATVTGTLNSSPNQTYRVEFFASSTADPSGYGEGQNYLGFTTVTTNSAGNASFSFTPSTTIPSGQFVATTATDAQGNTSEFSLSLSVAPPIVGRLSANSGTIAGILSTDDTNNPTRLGRFSDDYTLVDFTVGERVEISLSAPFDAYLQLINTDTQRVITFDNDSGTEANSLLSFIPVGGINYTVRATSSSSGATGDYILSANNQFSDLIVASTNAPTVAVVGETVALTWTVANQGTGTATRDWYDRVYLSNNQTLDGSDVQVTSEYISTQTPLAAGTNYTIRKNVVLPSFTPGNQYLLFVADRDNYQAETNENNNVRAVAIALGATNLVISNPTAPASAGIGETIDLSWTVTNNGNVSAPADWLDRVYISENQTLDNSDTLLLEINTGNNSPLLQGSSYTIEQSATIPNTEATKAVNRYLLFVANANDAQGENSRTDNIVAVPFEVKSPNLAFKEVNAPQSAVLGESIDLSWIIENKGTGTALANWFDTIYISDDNKIDYGVDTYVTRFDQAAVSPLAAGNEYNNAVNITLPLRTNPGDRYLLFLADGKYPQPTPFFRVDYPGDYQAETNEADNLYAVPISLIAPELVDLTVSGIVAPSEVISGQSIEISWFITNEGSDPITGTWNDKVFLSGNQTVGGDRFLKTFNFTGTIGAGETIERQQVIEIPIDISGEHWFVVQTDADDQKIEYFAENDNIRIDDTPINIILSPFPNLQVTAVNPPTTAFSSQQTVVKWTVTNNGNAPTNAPFWYDRVWLSKDNILDGTDINLGQAVNPNYLRVGENYTNQLTVTLPQGIDDNYYFIVKTDVNNNVYEFQKENDNVGVGSATDVQLTPPPDLQITSVTAPNNAFSGLGFSLTWTVQNKGAGITLQSQWYDEIFLSSDQILDGGDIFLGEFEHRGVLNADGSYTQTQLVGSPVDITGEYYFIVKADGRETVYEQAFESNNTGFDPTPTQIVLFPVLDDIEVKSVNIPNTVIAGHYLVVGTEVSLIKDNLGGNWVDAFYLSKDLEFDPETDIYLGDYQIRYPEIYNSNDKSLPDNIPTKVFTVGESDGRITLFYGYLRSLNTDRPFREELILTLDQENIVIIRDNLHPTSVIRTINPITAIELQDYRVKYNYGGNLYEFVPIYERDVSQTILEDNLVENTEEYELITDIYGSTQKTARVVIRIIDNDTIGIPNISVEDVIADEFERVLYFPIILDKASTESITVTYTTEEGTAGDGSDYTEVSGSVIFEPGEVVKNIPVSIRRDLESEGEETFNLVITNTTSGVIADNTGTATILTNFGYQRYALFQALPEYLQGDYYVVAVADSNNAIYEIDNENNIFFSPEPVTIVTPGEDLIVSSLTANKTIVNRGGYLYLDWTVTNTGTNSTINFDNLPFESYTYNGTGKNIFPSIQSTDNPIFDKIVISKDNIFGNSDDIELMTTDSKPDVLPENTVEFIKESNGSYVYQKNGNFYQAMLQPQDFYQRNFEPVLIPFNLTAGQYNLFVTTDTKQTIHEGNEANNYAVIPLTITSDIADLQVNNINILSDTNIKSGESLTFTWTVSNFGTNQTSSQTWQDQIYLSKDKVISNDDIVLTNQNHNNGLGAGDEYTKLTSNLIPINTVGDYYVLVRTDNNNSVQESSNENNVLASTGKISITLSDVPDLVIESVNAPATAISGQSFNINWQIANNGATTEASFYTSFYLSLDQNLDRSSDVYLGTNIQAIGNQNTFTSTFDIPRGLSGRYYAFAVVDSKNEIYERDGELNNSTYDPLSVEIILPPPADLVVTAINIPNQVITLGDDVGFSYTIQNQGADAALGNWFDSIYLSKDQAWDINDALVNKFNHQGNIAVGESYQGFASLSSSTPVTPGDYYVLVRSDIRNQVAETNDNNNLWVSLGKVTIDVEALALNTPTSDIINQDEAVYYRVNVAEGESLLFNFDGQYTSSDYGFTELYVSYGKMPTRNNFDFIYQVPLEADQQILVPTTEAGTYYVMAYGNTVPEYTGEPDGFNYTIEAKTIDFAVLDTDFGLGGTAGNRTIEINGNKFDRSVTAYLRGENGVEFAAEAYYFVDSTLFYPTFNLTQATAGIYDVVVKNAEGDIFIVDDSFEVVNGGGADLRTYLDVPEAVRRPQHDPAGRFQGQIGWYNQGLNDAYSPVLEVTSTAPISLDPDNIPMVGTAGEPFPGWDVTYLFGSSFNHYGAVEGDGPPGIIMPGQGDLLPFYGAVDPNPETIYTEVNIFQLSDPYPWEDVRDSIQPALMSDEEFAPIWDRLISNVGNTWADYLEMLSRNSNILPDDLLKVYTPNDILAFEFRKTQAEVEMSISGELNAKALNIEFSGKNVLATSIDNGQIFSSLVYKDGSFILNNLPAGRYEISVSDLAIDNGDRIVVEVLDNQSISDLEISVELGSSLKVSVLENGSLKPVDNPSVYLLSEGNPVDVGSRNIDGSYSFLGLKHGNYQVMVEAEGYASQIYGEVIVDGSEENIVVELLQESVIQGKLLFPEGVNSDDVIAFATLNSDTSAVFSSFLGVINDEGAFEITNLPEGIYNIDFFAKGNLLQSVSAINLLPQKLLDIGTLSLETGNLAESEFYTLSTSPDALDRMEKLWRGFGYRETFKARGAEFASVLWEYLGNDYFITYREFTDGDETIETPVGKNPSFRRHGTTGETLRGCLKSR